jgi:hypothetical protein
VKPRLSSLNDQPRAPDQPQARLSDLSLQQLDVLGVYLRKDSVYKRFMHRKDVTLTAAVVDDPSVSQWENPVVLFVSDIPGAKVGRVTRYGGVDRSEQTLPEDGCFVVDRKALRLAYGYQQIRQLTPNLKPASPEL